MLWILFELNLQLALISLCVLPLYVAIIRVFSPKIKRASHCFHEQFADFSGHLQERIAGASTVRSFGRGDYEANLFQHRTESIYHLTLDNVKLASLQQFLIELITRFAPLVIICAGTRLVWSGKMPLGTMVAFYAYVGLLYQPLQRFSETSMLISSSLAAIERVLQFFSERSEITQHPNSFPLVLQNGSIDFESVSFGYKNRESDDYRLVLDNINLHVESGTTVALVGRSGAGKTTLASLITRFYDVTAGRITIDGMDIRNVSLSSLSENIGIVTQDSVLFSVTVRENLLYGNPAADERALWRALDDANIKTFVESLPHRLDTIIGERGIKLSGGQSQRIALARIFLKNPAILILDEATSALDSESENLVHDAMKRLMHGRTSFLIAHRLSIASEADLIVVLDQGRIAEVGLHDDLLRNRGIYWKLVSEQTRRLSNLIAFPATPPREEAEARVA